MQYCDRGDGLIQSTCPCSQHGGDRNNETAWSWRTDLGKWVCWSHHCEDNRGNDVFGLVSSVLGLNFTQTVEWLEMQLESRNIDLDQPAPDPERLNRGLDLHTHEPIAEDNLKFLIPDPEYMINRGFSVDVLRKYEVGLWMRPGTYMDGRVIVPIRDHQGYLVGYTGRTIYPQEHFERRGLRYTKWIHGRHFNQWPRRGDLFTSSILFNLYRAKKYIEPHKKIILVEGPFDGFRLEEASINNWAGTLGTMFCHTHRSLLIKSGIKKIYCAYDNDDPAKYRDNESPGEKGWDRIRRIVGDLLDVERIELPSCHDVADLSIEQTKEIFYHAKA